MASKVFTIRRKVFAFLGAQFHVYDPEGNLVGYSKQKAFKLKEDIRIFTDESMSQERVAIKARSVIDFSAAYDVVDSKSGNRLGTLQRKGMASILRDSWLVLDAQGREVGKIQEDSMGMALVRRLLFNLVPQVFHFREDDGGEDYAEFRTHFNPFVHRLTVTIHDACPVPTPLVLAAGILLVVIEGRQK